MESDWRWNVELFGQGGNRPYFMTAPGLIPRFIARLNPSVTIGGETFDWIQVFYRVLNATPVSFCRLLTSSGMLQPIVGFNVTWPFKWWTIWPVDPD